MHRVRILSAVCAGLAFITALAPVSTATAAPSTSSLVWGACPAPAPGEILHPRQQCADLSVPADYRRPGGARITVAVSRIAASDAARRHGILLINPGGPGGSGLNMPGFLVQTLPAEVTARFDLIGFDPRGVGHSTPITCGLPPETPAELILPYPATDGSIQRNIGFARRTAADCAREIGALLPHITTANTARDMDSIRAAVGERKLSYLGYSYGSYLGAVYTSLFPQRSDRIILDSAINPNKIWYETWRGFGYGTALRLPDFYGWAARRDGVYGLGATPAEVEQYFFRTATKLDSDPLEVPGGLITGNYFRELTRSHLYDDRLFSQLAEIWQFLGMSTGSAPAAAPVALTLQVPIDNQIAVLYSIACNDIAWSRDLGLYERNTQIERRAFPATAGMPANVWPCVFWPHRPAEPPVAIEDDGPRNILVLQNLRDPATPWLGAIGMRVAFAKRSAMVTVDAGGHGIYGIRSGPCTDAIATAFLVTGARPAHDRFCQGPTPEDQTAGFASAPRLRLPGPLGVVQP